MTDLIEDFADALTEIANNVREWGLASLEAIAEWTADAWAAVLELGLDIWEDVAAFWEAATDIVADGFDKLTSFLDHVGQLSLDPLQPVKEFSVEAFQTMQEAARIDHRGLGGVTAGVDQGLAGGTAHVRDVFVLDGALTVHSMILDFEAGPVAMHWISSAMPCSAEMRP